MASSTWACHGRRMSPASTQSSTCLLSLRIRQDRPEQRLLRPHAEAIHHADPVATVAHRDDRVLYLGPWALTAVSRLGDS